MTKLAALHLQELPEDILNIILEYQKACEGELQRTSRLFWSLYVDICRHKFVKTFGQVGLQLVSHVKSNIDCRSVLGNTPSWCILKKFFYFDWCFWQKQHIVTSRTEEITDIEDNLEDAANGIWRVLTGPMKGVHASNVHWLHLKYNTKLFQGIYRVILNLRVTNFVRLLPVRFRINGSGEQHWKEFAPHTFRHNSDDNGAFEDYLNFKPVDICLGTVEIGPSQGQEDECANPDEGSLFDVEFEIEDTGVVMNRGILFRHLQFVRSDSHDPSQWYLLRKHQLHPTIEIKQAYEAFNDLKNSIEL